MAKKTVTSKRIKKLDIKFKKDCPVKSVTFETGKEGVTNLVEQRDNIIVVWADSVHRAYYLRDVFSIDFLTEEYTHEIDVPDEEPTVPPMPEVPHSA